MLRKSPAEAAEAGASAIHERAAAKLNLDLLITGRRDDGYHELDSLVVFADIADELTFRSAPSLSLRVEGPFAAGLPAGDGNIVVRAAERLAEVGSVAARAEIVLHKRLPVAAGIGGGSADAAAALRGLRRLWGLRLDERTLHGIGLELGADVPVCLHGSPARMRGIGERLDPVPGLPSLSLVLVNPRQPLATAAVFKALRLQAFGRRDEQPPAGPDVSTLAAYLQRTGNDLQAASRSLLPVIGEVLGRIAAEPGCRLARMSGSGPTCFGLFDTPTLAAAAAARLRTAQPAWWVAACRTMGSP